MTCLCSSQELVKILLLVSKRGRPLTLGKKATNMESKNPTPIANQVGTVSPVPVGRKSGHATVPIVFNHKSGVSSFIHSVKHPLSLLSSSYTCSSTDSNNWLRPPYNVFTLSMTDCHSLTVSDGRGTYLQIF
ncbi:hypothetical protein T08_6038 [Trichinella sp. T8]|nr:hypothetical protein T08_6038 [Trichinella sp. T8]